MGNGRKFRKNIRKEILTIDVGIPPDRKVIPGHMVELEKSDPDEMIVRCSCGLRWSGPQSDREKIEWQAYEHFMPRRNDVPVR